MRVRFVVDGLPPKKDGANSMWRKGSESVRLKALRLAASQAMSGIPAFSKHVQLSITLYSDSQSGDLDNFITGICDGLMAAHPNTPIDDSAWSDVPPLAHPSRAIAFKDDAIVARIRADRVAPTAQIPHYEVEIVGE
jgi:hypothetical protein